MLNNKKKILSYDKKVLLSAFTLAEIVIATFISTLVLSFLFIFLSDISNGIISTKNEVNVISNLYDFSYKLNSYRNIYNTGGILIDNTGTGSDIFLMKDTNLNNGILFGIVNLSNNKLYIDNSIYEETGIGFRKISNSELNDIENNTGVIYNYTFQDDQIFTDFKAKDLTFVGYNSGTIYDLALTLNIDFQKSLVGNKWDNLPKDSLKKINIDF